MFVAGVDGCHAGWIAFKIELHPSLATSLEVIDLPALLTNRPSDLAFLPLTSQLGPHGSRACDKEARRRLGQPGGTSVFVAPCREALTAKIDADASAINANLPQLVTRGETLRSRPKYDSPITDCTSRES
jgi:predicted RNase H-like nuclease